MSNRFDIVRNENKMSVEEYSNCLNIFKGNVPILVVLTNLISKEVFLNFFKNEKLYFTNSGNSTYLVGKISLSDNLETLNERRYIFSDICKTDLFQIMNSLIDKPNIDGEFIISRIYCGIRGTGSYFHHHPEATNYLISGRKLWVIFPPSATNYKYYLAHMRYGTVEENELAVWLNKNLVDILDNCHNCNIFIQESGTVVFIPNNFLHLVINLEDVIGITYSWKFNNKIYNKKEIKDAKK